MTASTVVKPGKKQKTSKDTLRALPWILPVLLLIFGVVVYPAGVMIYNSTRKISRTGLDKGSNGAANYGRIFTDPSFSVVLVNTLIWVVSVTVITIVVSLALAQFLDKVFPGRRIVRIAVIIPWASSVVMTTTLVYYALEPKFGYVQQMLYDLGITSSVQIGFTKQPLPGFLVAIAVAIFVSLPFTTYTILAGMQSIGNDVKEAAMIDGAGPIRTYFSVILPHLKPAIATATTINIINVFNNLPILKVLTGAIPGNRADITTTWMFKMIQQDSHLDWASALSVINFTIIILIIALYIVIVKPLKGVND